ncbi:SFT2-domain-containing protein, partial [Aureobasidium melanogenum]
MASSSFRDSMNSLGWSRREPAAMPTTSNSSTPFLGKLQSLNPFGQGGYVRLPLYENEAPGAPLPARTRREEEEGWFALSRWDRLLVFGALNLAAIALFVVCFTLMPVLTLRPRKFAIL